MFAFAFKIDNSTFILRLQDSFVTSSPLSNFHQTYTTARDVPGEERILIIKINNPLLYKPARRRCFVGERNDK